MSEYDPVLEKFERYIDRVSHAVAMVSYFVDILAWMTHTPERSCLVCPSFYCER